MGKKNKQKTKKTKDQEKFLSDSQLIKQYTRLTAYQIIKNLENTTVDDLISNIYINCEKDSIFYDFMKMYERQLILAKINEEEFIRELHGFFKSCYLNISKKRLFSEFFEFANFVYCNLQRRGGDTLVAYQNLLLQQYSYIEGINKMVYSVSDDGEKLFTIGELGKGLNIINSFIYKCAIIGKNPTDGEMKTVLSKANPSIKDEKDLDILRIHDQVTGNNIYQMVYYMNDETRYLAPKNYRLPTAVINFDDRLFESESAKELITKLKNRETLLPSRGIECVLNSNNFVNTITLHEIIKNNSLVLLYNVTFTDNTSTYGFFNPSEGLFYSMWKDSSAENTAHIPICNLVLGTYFNLSCSNKTVENIKTEEVVNYVETLIDEYFIDDKCENHRDNKDRRVFSKSEYKSKYMKISPFIRKLPIGAKASESAIEEARKYGITLREGTTFVREFNKVVYKTNDNN